MKKVALVLVMLSLTLGVFAQNGVIRQLSGTVELKHPGSADFVVAEVGDEVMQDTIVSTGFRSNALIAVGESSLITVRPLTRLTLTEISAVAGAETLNANLQSGRVRVDVNPPAGTRASMNVSSPSATASVRGTTLFFDGRNLGVVGGAADFRSGRGAPALVGDGFSSSLDATGRPTAPVFVFTGAAGEKAKSGDIDLVVGTFIDSITPTGQVILGSDEMIGPPRFIVETVSGPPGYTPNPPPPPPPPPPPGGSIDIEIIH